MFRIKARVQFKYGLHLPLNRQRTPAFIHSLATSSKFGEDVPSTTVKDNALVVFDWSNRIDICSGWKREWIQPTS